MAAIDDGQRNLGRSVLAVLAGMLSVIALSLLTDEVFHIANVYPPWGEPMWSPHLNALALSYRLVYDTFGAYLAARLAPRRPMKHAMIVGIVGFLLSGLGVAGTMMMAQKPGPLWYPVAIWITALPCAWLGGLWYRASARGRV
ncbi:MAG TPA: hypothetical protein VFV19_09675 [Candidatus Polarisedimenticolaceae bacterium]|nr:hypothetical protein [Candidatus Polarisedimenticolaceae bacterium]